MAINVQVSCIKHTGSRDQHGHILGIGGVYEGKRYYYPEPDAIKEIENGNIKFYTSVNGNSAWVIVVPFNGHKILKTEADGVKADNLLSLPQCP
jgi:hypothetical protein